MRAFIVGEDVPLDIQEAVDRYNEAEPDLDLGAEFADAAFGVLRGIEKHDEYITQPLLRLPHGNVHQILMDRFPYRIVIFDSPTVRLVLRVLHNKRDETHWRSRL